MGEQFELNLNPVEKQPTEPDPNADIDLITSTQELANLKDSLGRQILEAKRTDPNWATELEERLERVNARLTAIT